MAFVSGLPTPFNTLVEAKSQNDGDTTWDGAADDATREQAMQFARLYIDRTYKLNFSLTGTIPDSVKYAENLFAIEHLKTNLFDKEHANVKAQGLQENTVQAGAAKVTKKYNERLSAKWRDPFPSITAILLANGVAHLNKGSRGISTMSLVRG